jgi:integrase
VQKFSNELHAEGLSAAYVNHFVVLMRRYCSLAAAWNLTPLNVLKGIELIPVDNFRDTFLSEEETSRLVQVLTTDSNKLVCSILLFLLNTGARKMEAMKAKWSEIELGNRLWTVPAANNKSKKPKTLPLSESSMQVLMNLDSRGKSEYVFPNPATGLPMTTISRVWYRLRKLSGIDPKMRIHDTRACLAQRLLKNSASIETVAKILGNHPNMAYARYARFSTKTLLDAANAGSIPMPQIQPSAVGDAANVGSVPMPQPQAQAA